MNKNWSKEIESWKNIRDQADILLKRTLQKQDQNQHERSGLTSRNHQNFSQDEKIAIGRALLAYTRSDLTIKTIEIRRENMNSSSYRHNACDDIRMMRN